MDIEAQMPTDRFPTGARRPTVPEDNGEMHYGSGLRGSLCGVEAPGRREQSNWIGVTCPECLRQGNRGSRKKSELPKEIQEEIASASRRYLP